MVEYLPRSEWEARTPEGGPGLLDPDHVEGVAVHWPGTESHTPILSKAAVASALRGWQAYHMDGRGWSDIAYQVAVDQAGRAWSLRGFRTQSGANGNEDVNERYGAVLLVLVQGEEPSAAMKATTRAVIADFRRMYPKGTAIKGHRDVRPAGTDCPGPAAYAALVRGEFTPGTPTTPDKPEDDLMGAREDILAYQKACTIQIQNNTRQHVNRAVAVILEGVQKYAVAVNNFTRVTDTVSDQERESALERLRADLAAELAKIVPGQEPIAPDIAAVLSEQPQ